MFSKLTGNGRARWALGVVLFFTATRLFPATSSPWFARTWQADEGLPDNAVVGIAQTPDGFLWVATQGGLVRFDGNQFRDFAPITEVGVPSGLLHGLTVDRRGRLWVAKDGGVMACVDQGRTTSVILRRGSVNARAVTPWRTGRGIFGRPIRPRQAGWFAFAVKKCRTSVRRRGCRREVHFS